LSNNPQDSQKKSEPELTQELGLISLLQEERKKQSMRINKSSFPDSFFDLNNDYNNIKIDSKEKIKKDFSQKIKRQNTLDFIQFIEHSFLNFWFQFQLQFKLIYLRIGLWIRGHFFVFFLLTLVISVITFGIGTSVRQSLVNVDQNKSQLLEKIRLILKQNDKDQLVALNEVEKKLLEAINPIASWPIIGWSVKQDVSKIKDLSALWLDLIYPFANYKLGTDGFRTTLLQDKYFTADLDNFLTKSPQFLSRTRNDLNSLWLYSVFGSSQVKELFSLLNNILDIIEILNQNHDLVLTIFGHFQTQKIVIFNQNTGEARPTGGFIGSYIPIDIAKGEMEIGQSQSIYHFDRGTNTNLVAHPITWYYGFSEGNFEVHGARNSNFFACFPVTAKYLEREFSATPNGYTIDTLVMITPQFLLGYLPDNFVLEIRGEKIPKNFILNKIEQITALEIEDIENPKKQLTSIFNLIVSQLPEVLKGQALAELLNYTQESLVARDLQVWFRTPKIQSLWLTTGFAGDQTCAWKNKQVIAPILINLSVDKRNLITINDFQISKNGTKVNLDYTQFIPNDAPTVLARGFNRFGFSMFGVQVPAGSKVKVESDQKIVLPFLRDYYDLYINYQTKNKVKYIYPPEVQKVIDSSYDLNGDQESGFTYTQPDGSEVFGIYVSDKDITKVKFQIELPTSDELTFFGQPGVNLPILRYRGNNIANQRQIQTGVKID
jgi:Protein of unknown function (DUF4012)